MRRSSVIALLAFAAWVAPLGSAAAQQNFDTVQVRSQKLTDRVYMLQGAGGNIGLIVGDDGAFVVDDQFAPLADKIKAAIGAITDKPVRFVVNTHWHGDHTGGNERMGQGGAVIVAHDNVRRRMSTEQFNRQRNVRTPASPAAALPVITFAEAVTFHLDGDSIEVVHLGPAHTDGDAIIYFRKANVVHMGDTYFKGMYPFIDMASGGSVDGVVAGADRVLALTNNETKIIPGHGPLASRADLMEYRRVVGTIRDRVKSLIEQGKNLTEVAAARPAAEFDATWGRGYFTSDVFVDFVYTSLGGKR